MMRYFLVVLFFGTFVTFAQENPWLNKSTNPWEKESSLKPGRQSQINKKVINQSKDPWLSNSDSSTSNNTIDPLNNREQLISEMSAEAYGTAHYKDPVKVVSKALWIGLPVIGLVAIPVASLSVVITNTTSTKRIRKREKAVIDDYFKLHSDIAGSDRDLSKEALRKGMKRKRYLNLAKGIGIGLAGQIAFWINLEFF
jgi:hypothetical protein